MLFELRDCLPWDFLLDLFCFLESDDDERESDESKSRRRERDDLLFALLNFLEPESFDDCDDTEDDDRRLVRFDSYL